MPTTGNAVHIKFGTQTQYNASTKDANSIYFVTDTKEIYLGADKYGGSSSAGTITGANRGLSVSGNNVGHSNTTVTAVTTASLKKVAYDTYGHITNTTDVAATDIPALPASKITSGTFADERIASAATWNAKQNAITFNTAYNASTNKAATMSDINTAISGIDLSTKQDQFGTVTTVSAGPKVATTGLLTLSGSTGISLQESTTGAAITVMQGYALMPYVTKYNGTPSISDNSQLVHKKYVDDAVSGATLKWESA